MGVSALYKARTKLSMFIVEMINGIPFLSARFPEMNVALNTQQQDSFGGVGTQKGKASLAAGKQSSGKIIQLSVIDENNDGPRRVRVAAHEVWGQNPETTLFEIHWDGTKPTYIMYLLPTYADDAAATADTELPSGGIYKITGSTQLHSKA